MNVGSFGFTPEMLDRLRQTGGLNSTTNASAPYQVDLGQVPDGTSADYAGQDWNKFMADWGPADREADGESHGQLHG